MPGESINWDFDEDPLTVKLGEIGVHLFSIPIVTETPRPLLPTERDEFGDTG